MTICVLEYAIESWFVLLPFKGHFLFTLLGACGVLVGHYFRIGA